MKKKSLVLVLLAPALLCPGAAAAAETVLTPTQLQSAPHTIYNFSVWQGDSTIAFDVSVAGGATNIWTIQRFATVGIPLTSVTYDGQPCTANTIPEGQQCGAHHPSWAPFNPQFSIPPNPNQPPTQTNTIGILAYVQDTSVDVNNFVNRNELIVSGYGSQSVGVAAIFAGTENSYAWSLDAARFVMAGFGATSNSLYTSVLGGTGATPILEGCAFQLGCDLPAWSPTQDAIAYNRGGSIFLINPNGSNNHQIVPGSQAVPDGLPIWSPNTGANIAYECNIGGVPGAFTSDICVASSDGANPTNMTNGALGLFWLKPSWSIDEQFIAMLGVSPSAFYPPAVSGDIYVMPAKGGTPVQITKTGNVKSPQFSPITNEIFYVCNHGADDDLCVVPQAPQTGGGPPTCSPSNCSGCCLQNLCVPGFTASACGAGGNACVACPGNEVCASGSQTCSAPPLCDASTCNGCCDASGTCHAGTQSSACGAGGAGCVACVGSEVCNTQHRCESNLCSAATCSGCCNAKGQCDKGTSAASCGANGFACVACPGNEICNANSRTCEAPQLCNVSSCPTGCCNASGACEAGTSPTSCGTAGAACVSCNGGVCDNNSHTCGSPATCSELNCGGCCGPTGCLAGDTNAACGNSGFTCQVCTSPSSCDFSSGLCE